MSAAPSYLGMAPARRRIFEAGYAAQAQIGREIVAAHQERMTVRAAPTLARMTINMVASFHGVTFDGIAGRSYAARVVKARHECMWQLAHARQLSCRQIGTMLGGRSHSAVIHGIRQHQKLVDAATQKARP